MQSWSQRKLSSITFSIKPAYVWDYDLSRYEEGKRRSADVYVFCLLHHTDKNTVDPLNLDQWTFYVLATAELNNYKRSQHSITLNSLQKLTKAINYAELNQEIIEKKLLNENC